MFSLFPPFHSSMGFSLRMASGSLFFFFFFFFINLFLFSFSNQTAKAEAEFSNISSISSTTSWGKCNWHQGKWVYDSSYPLYDSYKCPFIDPQFNCQKFGRRDSAYLKYRWQPFSCSLPKFNGLYFLEKYRGKKIMFVGDSISANQFQSLTCMIHAWVPNTRYSYIKAQGLSSVTFQDYGLQIYLYKTTYLVDLVYELKVGTVLKLDSIRNGNMWKGMDMLIFNSWHWWTHTGSSQPFDYFEEKNKLYKDMNRMIAYYKGLTTWARWVNLNVDPSKTKVFYQGISPTHYDGRDWQQPLKSCNGQTQPFFGPKYPAGTPVAWYIVKKVLSRIKKPVTLLDITQLSQFRKDAHPSAYSGEHSGVDCSHWCLPGLPDTWNQLLYASLFG